MTSDKPVSVLVVDDDEAMLEVYSRVLVRAGYRCVTARSGAEALIRLHESSVDVVLTDLIMENMSGLELIGRVRARDPDIPILVATGAPGIESALCSIDAGVFRYLTKPLNHAEVVRSVGDAVHARSLAQARRAAYEYVGAGRRKQLVTEEALLEALATMRLAVQPIVRTKTRKVVAYEALLRTTHPVLGDPTSLLNASDTLGMHKTVGRAVRRLAAELTSKLTAGVDLFVNLHPCDLLDPELFSKSAPLSMCARRVVLEITERASLDTVADVRTRVAELKGLGFRVAIDDMGAGYAGLNSFAMLRPDFVKIDLSLVRDVDSDSIKQTLIRSIVDLGRALEIEVIAECVETASEREMLTTLGCELLQGYLLARPGMPFPQVSW
ncbi:MAG: Response regulator of zinc sigma-54-dependent two-component system [Myxococcaceae bacterium]|nr:Response regulator of zinc sigma-54-dependent two-component system [Myxococcaceae bacterium]